MGDLNLSQNGQRKKTVRNKQSFKLWLDKRFPFFSVIQKEYIQFPMPKNLNIWWTFGAVLTVILFLMLLTGIFLTLYYTAMPYHAFLSIEMIERRVPSGWLIRSIHMAGSNLFLAFLYLHLFRGLYYGSYKSPRELVWCSGMILTVSVMITAFAGYILPWGQMSYWAANVIIQAISSIPIIGQNLSGWLMGGEIPNALTLHRYYTIHFVMAFVICFIVFLHIICMHHVKSNNPEGIDIISKKNVLPFFPYFVAKDGLVLGVSGLIMVILIFFEPGLLTNSENYIPANPLETPASIAPEWYFLPFYGILQIIPYKFGGMALSAGTIFLLFLVPWLDSSPVKSARYRPIYRISLIILVIAFVMLGIVGKFHTFNSLIWLGRLSLLYYYCHFLVILPLSARFEIGCKLHDSSLCDNK